MMMIAFVTVNSGLVKEVGDFDMSALTFIPRK